MTKKEMERILTAVRSGAMDVGDALEQMQEMPLQRSGIRQGGLSQRAEKRLSRGYLQPWKSLEQIQGIVADMLERTKGNILASRADEQVYAAIRELTEDAVYYKDARSVVVKRQEYPVSEDYIAVVTAGTSDIPVAEEAAVTAMVMGNAVRRLYDVGVAGIHRLLDNVEVINRARVIIVVAGMEGALASVVGGLTDKPVIAVPTSIGYGANFGGISALLGMLTSCASGIGVVNIDNGFGAACMASKINQL